jgi:hypothetical protein
MSMKSSSTGSEEIPLTGPVMQYQVKRVMSVQAVSRSSRGRRVAVSRRCVSNGTGYTSMTFSEVP